MTDQEARAILLDHAVNATDPCFAEACCAGARALEFEIAREKARDELIRELSSK